MPHDLRQHPPVSFSDAIVSALTPAVVGRAGAGRSDA